VTWGRLDPAQSTALAAIVRGRTVHDLGCGDQTLAEKLVQLGAAAVIAVDCQPMDWTPVAGVVPVHANFADYADTEPVIDVAFVAWPDNRVEPALLELIRRAKTVAYLGKCTDATICGWPGFFRYLLGRALVAHVPNVSNTLCVYGEPLARPWAGEWEERAGIDGQTIRPYSERRTG
jgi:hypothetical protein